MAWKRRRARSSESDAPPPDRVSARTAALRLLGRRDYTVAELRERLLAREYTDEEIAPVIAGFLTDRSLDDTRVAASHARTSSAIKGRGRHRIARELQARGVSGDIAGRALSALNPADEDTAIDRFLERKRLPAQLAPADRRRVFQQLLRRGFPADAIGRALHRRGHPRTEEDPN